MHLRSAVALSFPYDFFIVAIDFGGIEKGAIRYFEWVTWEGFNAGKSR